jgi:hypothetical protein
MWKSLQSSSLLLEFWRDDTFLPPEVLGHDEPTCQLSEPERFMATLRLIEWVSNMELAHVFTLSTTDRGMLRKYNQWFAKPLSSHHMLLGFTRSKDVTFRDAQKLPFPHEGEKLIDEIRKTNRQTIHLINESAN